MAPGMEAHEREDLERKSSRRQPAGSSRRSPTRDRSKVNNLRKSERERVIRKLDDDFKLEEDDDDDEPLTPAEALISAQDYLSRARTSSKGKSNRYTSIALQIMKDAIDNSAPKNPSTRRQARERTPDREPSDPDDDDDDRRGNPNRGRWRDDGDDSHAHRSTRRDARDDIAQSRVNRSRRRRAAREEYSDEE